MENISLQKRREAEFEDIVREYSLMITKVCYYFAADSAELNDLRQDVLLNIWTGLHKFRKESKLSTWIYRISFNTCIIYQRKNKRWKNEVPLTSLLDITDDAFDMEKYNEMHRLIERLGAEEKAIVMMWLDGNSYNEIADVIGVNRNTIATRLKRIKDKLVRMSNE